jgi:hypothetical protein
MVSNCALSAIVFALVAGHAAAQISTQRRSVISTQEGCFQHYRVQRDASGSPVILTTRELDRMVADRQMPTFPPMSARITGSLRMKVLVDSVGLIRCAVRVQGHPLLAGRVTEALEAWRFRPYADNGKATPVVGFLDFRFEASDPRLVFMDLNFEPTPTRVK